jgi:hypothetical protein
LIVVIATCLSRKRQTHDVDVVLVTVVCLTALGVATAMAWQWSRLERRPPTPMEPGWPAALRTLRSLAVTVNTALIAGILVGGFGGRLFMRIMAATSGDKAQGLITQAEETVGEVTVGGTAALIVFGGIFGGIASAGIYRALRRWLPARAWQAGLVLAVIALGAGGRATELLSPENRDFEILRPVGLAVALVVVLVAGFGVVFVAVYERLERGFPALDKSIGLAAYVPLLLLSIVPVIGVTVAVITVLSTQASTFMNRWTESQTVARVGRVLTIAVLALTTGVAAADAAAILT